MTNQKKINRKVKNDLSHIDTLEDLHTEMRLIKSRLKIQETEMTAHWKKLPAETFKLAVRKVVPFYLNNKVLDKSWGLVSGIVGLSSAAGRKTASKNVLGNAKKLGLFTAIRAGYNLLSKKKNA